MKAGAGIPEGEAARSAAAPSDGAPDRMLVGMQVGAISFVDEGIAQVLDILQERGAVNALFLATFTYGRGIAGRQIPGHPLPDHGKQEYDTDFHGGNYAMPHAEFYRHTSLKETRAPDHGNLDILEAVLPAAHERGIQVYCWYEDVFRGDVPGVKELQEVDLYGRPAGSLCPLHPDYSNFLIGLTQDYCSSYPIDGLMWGSERQGPLHNALGARHGGPADSSRVTCFCDRHKAEARKRGIDPGRAIEGYRRLDRFVQAVQKGNRPPDGCFVEFWRILLDYPEMLAWEKLWTDGKHAICRDIHRAAKGVRPNVKVGFHIWHANSFSPFFRAEQEYARFAESAGYLKIVLYNNCGGPRFGEYIRNVGQTLFGDVPAEELLQLHHHLLGYQEKDLESLRVNGLSADYVARETRRTLVDVNGKCAIYPGIDIDIPTGKGEKKTSPEDVHTAVTAAFGAGAQGVILSRKYSEMRLANLSAAGHAARSFERRI